MKYTFKNVERCNMCGESATSAKVLGRRLNQSQGVRPTKKTGITVTVVKCRGCALVYTNPMPIPETISQHYGTPPEDYWKPEYFTPDPGYFLNQIAMFRSLYEPKSSLTGLDIGAGVGKGMRVLGAAGFDAYGLEPSTPFYTRAIEITGIDPSRIQNAQVEDAEYAPDSFDLITFGAVLEHLYDPSAAILQALRWVKPSGLIHIEVPSSAWLTNRIFNLIYRIQGLDYVANVSPMHTPFHLYEFGLASFRAHARQYGYEVAHHQYFVSYTFLPRIISPAARFLMHATDSGMQLEVWLRKSS